MNEAIVLHAVRTYLSARNRRSATWYELMKLEKERRQRFFEKEMAGAFDVRSDDSDSVLHPRQRTSCLDKEKELSLVGRCSLIRLREFPNVKKYISVSV